MLAKIGRNKNLIKFNDGQNNCLQHAYCRSFALFKSSLTISLSSLDFLASKPRPAIKTASKPVFTPGRTSLIIPLNLLFALFLKNAFLENFNPALKVKRLVFSLFLTNLMAKASSLRVLPFLKTSSRSFFFLSRLATGSISDC